MWRLRSRALGLNPCGEWLALIVSAAVVVVVSIRMSWEQKPVSLSFVVEVKSVSLYRNPACLATVNGDILFFECYCLVHELTNPDTGHNWH